MITQAAHRRLLSTDPVPQNILVHTAWGLSPHHQFAFAQPATKIPAGWFYLIQHSSWISTRATVRHARTEVYKASLLQTAAWMGGCMASPQLLACILCLVVSAGFFFLANSRSRATYGLVPNFPANTTNTREPAAPLLRSSAPAKTQPCVEPPARNRSANSDSRMIVETAGIRLNSRGRRSRYSTFSCTGPQLHKYLPSRFSGATVCACVYILLQPALGFPCQIAMERSPVPQIV